MKTLFEFIQCIFENILFLPLHCLRKMELSSWFGANFINFSFILICTGAIGYWIGQLRKFDKNNEEDTDVVAHSYLGKNK